MMEPGYEGDKDVDHLIEENRHRFNDEHREDRREESE